MSHRVRLGDHTGTLLRYCPHKLIAQVDGVERVIPSAEWAPRRVQVEHEGRTFSPLELPQARVVGGSVRPLLALLGEAKDHYPFKRKAKLGPAVRGGTNKKAGKWDCDCSNNGSETVCQCDDTTGETNGKTVRIPLSYKRAYNKDYRAWLKKKAVKGKPKAKAA